MRWIRDQAAQRSLLVLEYEVHRIIVQLTA